MDIVSILSGSVKSVLIRAFKPAFELVERILFEEAYKASTEHHIYRALKVDKPEKFGCGISCDVIWQTYFLRRKLTNPVLRVSAHDGAEFKKIVLCVTAFADVIRYQDVVILYDVGEVVVQTALPSIPLRDLKLVDDGRSVRLPYNTYQVRILCAERADGATLPSLPVIGQKFTPMDNLLPLLGRAQGDVEKWGEIYNLEFIHTVKQEATIDAASCYTYASGKLGRLKHWGLTSKIVVNLKFWKRNIFTGKEIWLAYSASVEKHKFWDKIDRS